MKRISESTVRRLSLYLRLLREVDGDRELVSSQELAERSGTTAAQVRKDLSLFGSFGQRGRGYDVAELMASLQRILGVERRWKVAVVGVGKLGSALLGYRELARRGFDVVAAFDADARKVGAKRGDLEVCGIEALERVIRERAVEIAIVATPPEAARPVVQKLADAGVLAILNFAPIEVDPEDAVVVRTMDLALELEALTFALTPCQAGERAGG